MALHPKGLTPFEAAKAWHLRQVQKLPWRNVREQVRAISGEHPNKHALVHAVKRVHSQRHTLRSQEGVGASWPVSARVG